MVEFLLSFFRAFKRRLQYFFLYNICKRACIVCYIIILFDATFPSLSLGLFFGPARASNFFFFLQVFHVIIASAEIIIILYNVYVDERRSDKYSQTRDFNNYYYSLGISSTRTCNIIKENTYYFINLRYMLHVYIMI